MPVLCQGIKEGCEASGRVRRLAGALASVISALAYGWLQIKLAGG